MSKYYEWDQFKNIYLEDSFVLNIEDKDNKITFTVEAVLTEKHPHYSPPQQNEKYCYKTLKIVFNNMNSVKWFRRSGMVFTDADHNEDHGNIDCFELLSEEYHLAGDWGEVRISSSEPEVVWLP